MNMKLDKIFAEISAGELVDKITILEIKKIKIKALEKIKDVNKELLSLNETFKKYIDENIIKNEINKLKEINSILWEIESKKRSAEKKQKFDKDFINLARSVYKTNDERAKIKLKINQILRSNIKEVKSHY